MCGIAGVLGPASRGNETLRRAAQSIRHRGPDASGQWSGAIGALHLDLLHTRLAIIDLDMRAAQPFEAEGCVLVFNGEIYNYRELRQELKSLGWSFRTESDTEVLAIAYRAWGPDCVNRFEGMWALALYDSRTNQLWLSRDRLGEKPLYVAHWDGCLFFASEVKALTALAGRNPQVNQTQLRRYLVNGYKSLKKQPATFWDDVEEFPAGSSALLQVPAQYRPQQYWNLSTTQQSMSRADAVQGVVERLTRATELCMRADVPVGFCLSGGVDSGALASIAARRLGCDIHAFSIIDTDDRYDESREIGAVVTALGCAHTAIHTSRHGFLDRLQRQVQAHDAPVATISYYLHGFLSEAIAANGYKVAISGTGADEIFTGYYDHYAFWLADRVRQGDRSALVADWKSGMGSVVRNPYLQDPFVFEKNPGERGHIYLDRAVFNDLLVAPFDEDFFEQSYSGDVLRNRMLNELMHESVPIMLQEDDLNSMMYSIENRSPFLNAELISFMNQVPSEHLIHQGFTKSILRDAVDGLLPDAVRCDRRKRGFNGSILSLIDPHEAKAREWLLDHGSPIFDYVARDRFSEFIDGDFTDNASSKFLFSFISAKCFLESPLCGSQKAQLSEVGA